VLIMPSHHKCSGLRAVPLPGMFLNGITVDQCPRGSFCLGGQRAAQPIGCGEMLTTKEIGSTSPKDCGEGCQQCML